MSFRERVMSAIYRILSNTTEAKLDRVFEEQLAHLGDEMISDQRLAALDLYRMEQVNNGSPNTIPPGTIIPTRMSAPISAAHYMPTVYDPFTGERSFQLGEWVEFDFEIMPGDREVRRGSVISVGHNPAEKELCFGILSDENIRHSRITTRGNNLRYAQQIVPQEVLDEEADEGRARRGFDL